MWSAVMRRRRVKGTTWSPGLGRYGGTLNEPKPTPGIGGFVPPDRPAPVGPQGAWAANLGPERAARGGMWKSISDAGGRVVFGSDWGVASMDAMGRIHNITHRAVRPEGTDQRIVRLRNHVDVYIGV